MAAPITLEALLLHRERRAASQRAWLGELGLPLLSVTLVTPGPVKDSPTARYLIECALGILHEGLSKRQWPVARQRVERGDAGCEALFAVRAEPLELKRFAAQLEREHPLGRLWDLDVVGLDGVPLTRAQVGQPPRRCLLCEEPAAACARARAHPLELLSKVIEERVAAFGAVAGPEAPSGANGVPVLDAETIGAWAHEALAREAALTPKPGLVDGENSGAHSDMDLATFRAALAAMRPYWPRFFAVGAEEANGSDGALLRRLRALGLECEGAMFGATGGVNTHKGAIFSLGLLCGCAGKLAGRALDVELLCAEAARVTAPLVATELRGATKCGTAGEQLYRRHGMVGARGEAASGFATVRLHALPSYRALRAELGEELAMHDALLRLMANAGDTNVAKDGGLEGVGFVQRRAAELLGRGGASCPGFIEELRRLDAELIERNLSPGGCADLLAVTCFLANLP